MAIERYPAVFPQAQRDPLTITVDMGVRRSPMATGVPRQMRRYKSMPHYFGLEFVVPISMLYQWQTWVGMHAFKWFELPLVNAATANDPVCNNYCVVRFASDLNFSVVNFETMRISVSAELAPGQLEL